MHKSDPTVSAESESSRSSRNEEDTNEEDTNEEDTNEEDTNEEDTNEEDTNEEDTNEEDTNEEDTNEEDTKEVEGAMEARVLSGASFTQPGQASRMVKDLSICSQNFLCNWKERLAAKAKQHQTATARRHQQLHVGIVGAGLAGLRCAEVLTEADIHVTLIEARDRVGGRVSSPQLTENDPGRSRSL